MRPASASISISVPASPPKQSRQQRSQSHPLPLHRSRSSSIGAVYNYIKDPPTQHHLLHLSDEKSEKPRFDSHTPLLASDITKLSRARASSLGKGKLKAPLPVKVEVDYGPTYLRWIQKPSESLNLIATVIVLYFAWEVVAPTSITLPDNFNPFKRLLFISGPLNPDLGVVTNEVRYGRSWYDLPFLAFYVVVFSYVRQASTLYVIKPIALKLGIKPGRKLERFQEQVRECLDTLQLATDQAVLPGICCTVFHLLKHFRIIRHEATRFLVVQNRIFLPGLPSYVLTLLRSPV